MYVCLFVNIHTYIYIYVKKENNYTCGIVYYMYFHILVGSSSLLKSMSLHMLKIFILAYSPNGTSTIFCVCVCVPSANPSFVELVYPILYIYYHYACISIYAIDISYIITIIHVLNGICTQHVVYAHIHLTM